MISRRRRVGPALTMSALIAVALSGEVAAQGQVASGLQVHARVSTTCSILAETPTAEAIPQVRVVCGRAGLRALRVSTGSGDHLAQAVGLAARQMLAGGEVVFTVPMLVGTVAGHASTIDLSRANEPMTVVVTLHF